MNNLIPDKKYYLLVPTLLFLFTSCAIRPVTVKDIGNFSASSLISQSEVELNLELENPNGYGVTVKNVNVAFNINDSSFAGIHLEKKLRIPARGTVMMPLTMKLGKERISTVLQSGLSNLLSGKSTKFEVQGEFKIRKFIFSRKYKFSEVLLR